MLCKFKMDHVQFAIVLSSKKSACKSPAQIQDCICEISVLSKGKTCIQFFLNNQPLSVITMETRAFLIIIGKWLLASVKIKTKHQSMGK